MQQNKKSQQLADLFTNFIILSNYKTFNLIVAYF
jgi:hypothetical protein